MPRAILKMRAKLGQRRYRWKLTEHLTYEVWSHDVSSAFDQMMGFFSGKHHDETIKRYWPIGTYPELVSVIDPVICLSWRLSETHFEW